MPVVLRSPFVVAVIVSLLLTIVRLVGELADGPESLFGRAAGGGGALLGVGWLIPVVGAWFGWRLLPAAQPPDGCRRAMALVGVGLLGVAAVFTAAKVLLPVTLGTFVFVAVSLPLLAITALRAWPALARPLLLYALVVRLAIAAITIAAVQADWGTHYERLAPGAPEMSALGRTVVLCASQLCLWIPLTVLIGCFAGLVAVSWRLRGSRG